MRPLELKVLIGSTREGRAADLVAPWLVRRAREHGAFDVDVLDLRDWPLPLFAENRDTIGDIDDPTYSQPVVKEWNQRIGSGEAFLFLTPEYNHSVPGVLKNAIDTVWLSFGFRNKPAGFVAYSAGVAAGVRAVEHLAHIAIEAEMVPLRNSVLIANVQQAFDDGRPRDQGTETSLDVLLADLQWWGEALRRARTEGELPPASRRRTAAVRR
jgi:NAD(P)H-dependent FMN reductase